MADNVLTAKERKRKAKPVLKAGRRSGRVTVYVDRSRVVKRPSKPKQHPVQHLVLPGGLSPEARFMELRPEGYSPIDWLREFTPDESIWPEMVEEAIAMLAENRVEG